MQAPSESPNTPLGIARFVGSLPNPDIFATGDLELYHVSPPLCGFNVVAASKSLWAMHFHPPDSPKAPEDPVSTAFYA
ncbi:hypothetical protein ACX9NE_08865 [Mycobacterium sp. ML4]